MLAELASIHPRTPDKLLPAFHDTFDSLTNFVRTHHNHYDSEPDAASRLWRNSAVYAGDDAGFDGPARSRMGPHSTKAYFNVTLPEKDWTPERVSEHMAAFNVGTNHFDQRA